MKPKYRFYATLLDSYQYYLTSNQDEAFQELINKINRVPYERSDAAKKGVAFNNLVDYINRTGVRPQAIFLKRYDKYYIDWDGFKFEAETVYGFADYFDGAASQVFTTAELDTGIALVELYGFADKVRKNMTFDIKCSNSYEFPMFTLNWQHKVYPYCFNKNSIFIDLFEYTVTDYNNLYKEQYVYNAVKDIPLLQSVCNAFITFLETHRALITDKKVFALI